MAQPRKNDSVVNIDAWSEDEDRAVIAQSDKESVESPGELNRPRTGPDRDRCDREILRQEFPVD